MRTVAVVAEVTVAMPDRPQLRGEDVPVNLIYDPAHRRIAALNTWWQRRVDLERDLDELVRALDGIGVSPPLERVVAFAPPPK